MARVMQPIRRAIISQTQALLHHTQFQPQTRNPISWTSQFLSSPARYSSSTSSSSGDISEMRKAAIENNLLRVIRNEIKYEVDNRSPQQPPAIFNGFKVVERPGEQWISLEKRYGNSEDIKVEVTMFDGSIPIPKDVSGEEDNQLHITMIITIFKEKNDKVLEFICSAWPDTLEIQKLFVREKAKMPRNDPYTGPVFGELDDELQDSLHNFLELRGIDDDLCTFLHRYIEYKDQVEYVRWLGSVKSVLDKQ